MDAGCLNCPECGAAVSENSTQCPYCHSLLQTVACTRCMGMMFVGSKFCSHCGAPATTLRVGEASNHNCPRCKSALQQVRLGKTPLEECMHCGGLWIDPAGFDTICGDIEAQTAASGMQLPPPIARDPYVHYLNCPQCRKLMGRVNYYGASGAITNVCKLHGVWLDRDQLRQIIEFIRAGGIDRARKQQIEELERQKKQIEFDRSTPMIENDGPYGLDRKF